MEKLFISNLRIYNFHSRLPASFHYAVFLNVNLPFLSGLPFFALLKTSSLTSTRGVPKANTHSGLSFFALLKTSSLTSTRGVPKAFTIQDCRLHFITPSSLTSTRGVSKASTIPRCGIAGRFYLFAFSSELESP